MVTMSIDDFFLVYSGSVSAFELTRMFFQHRIVIENHDFSKVKSFASSFDYSTAKWNEFYSVMEKRKEVVVKFLVDCRVGSVVTVYFLFPFTSSIFCESSPLQPILALLSSFLSLLGARCLFISTCHFITCLRTTTSVLSLLFSGGFATRVFPPRWRKHRRNLREFAMICCQKRLISKHNNFFGFTTRRKVFRRSSGTFARWHFW